MTNNNQDNKHSNSQGHSYVVELNNSTIKKLVFIIVAALVIGWGLTNINILTSVIANFFSVLSVRPVERNSYMNVFIFCVLNISKRRNLAY